ncbi:phosphate ABC transporter permease PstA [Jatrophihabitans sp.]|uniref:phosphate ABC transporter permease PstA n=1 Tax=Jatrophihabitans sp. TaxID=1932789 RepID=UPI0030C66291|nr:Phosphate transport system permease protein PstA [Jatrophihabitans sp.]
MTTLQDPHPNVGVEVEVHDDYDDAPRDLSVRTADDNASLIGSVFASLALDWVIYEKILAFSGIVGFVICWWLLFTALYAGVTAIGNPLPVVIDRIAASVTTSGAAIVGGVLGWVIIYTFVRGWPALHHVNFYTQNMTGVRPTAPLTQGGIWFAIVGSAIQVGIATAIAVPLGVGTAIFLTEVGGPVAKIVRTVVEAMTALPDILAGLFIYSLLIIAFGWEQDGFAVSLALAVTMTPIVARSAEVVLRVVPGGLREASLALGASNFQTVRRVVLPTARSGLATSLILGVARVAGETAPLLILSAATTFWNKNPLKHSMSSLPLFIYTEIRSGEERSIQRGYGAASVLLTLVLILFVAARLVARDKTARKRPPSQRRLRLPTRVRPGAGSGTGPGLPASPQSSADLPIPPPPPLPPPAAPSQGAPGYLQSNP